MSVVTIEEIREIFQFGTSFVTSAWITKDFFNELGKWSSKPRPGYLCQYSIGVNCKTYNNPSLPTGYCFSFETKQEAEKWLRAFGLSYWKDFTNEPPIIINKNLMAKSFKTI
jgi:hypothetical protein